MDSLKGGSWRANNQKNLSLWNLFIGKKSKDTRLQYPGNAARAYVLFPMIGKFL